MGAFVKEMNISVVDPRPGWPRHVSEVVDERPKQPTRGLFNHLTGECFLAPTSAAGIDTILEERGFFDLAPDDAIDRMLSCWLTVPVRNPAVVSWSGSRATVYRPDALEVCLLPRSDVSTFVIREALDEDAGRLYSEAATGHRLAEISRRLGWSNSRLYDALCDLARPERQLVRLASSREQVKDIDAQLHFAIQSFSVSGPAMGAHEHYCDPSLEAEHNFGWAEPTVAWSFRTPTEALGGKNYGAALLKAVNSHMRAGSRTRILEIGGGSGSLAAGFLRAADEEGLEVEYHMQDVSAALLGAQVTSLGARARTVGWHHADAQCSMPDLGFDVIILNEVIADLEVRLDPSGRLLQVGAERVIRQIRERLLPNGIAVITEYGSLSRPPEVVSHLRHVEHAVDFAALREHASIIGLHADVTPLAELLEFHLDTSMLVGQQERHRCLHAALSALGFPELEARAYTETEFRNLFGVAMLQANLGPVTFAPMYRGTYFGPDVRQFLALCLTLPGAIHD